MSGIDDGLAGNVCDTTTTGTTSMLSLIVSSAVSIAPFPEVNPQIGTARRHHLTHQSTWTNRCLASGASGQICPSGRLFCLVLGSGREYSEETGAAHGARSRAGINDER